MDQKTERALFSFLLLAGFLLLAVFLTNFFTVMSGQGYWHFMDIGAYLSRAFFAVDKGFFAEIPYWNYGYGYVSFALYPPMFFLASTAIYSLLSLTGFSSVYWSFFLAFLASYVFAFALTWKISKRNVLAYLLTVGNFFSLGLLVLMGFNTKIFAFNLAFPGIAYLLDKRKKLELSTKAIAGFSILLAAIFASHFFLFVTFSLLYLGIALQNRKALLRNLVPFVFVPILTLPYFASFFSNVFASVSGTGIASMAIGMSLNFYTVIFVAFVLLFLASREWLLAPLAVIAGLAALNLNTLVPVLANFEVHSSALFFLGIIAYYAVNWRLPKAIDFVKNLVPARPSWVSRQNILLGLLFALLLINIPYFAPRIEAANLFNNEEYRPLLEFGELESVFFVADLEGKDRFIMPYVSYQTFTFHNLSVNDWFPVGPSYTKFSKDREVLVRALKQADCPKVVEMAEKMQVKTLVIKNLPEGFSCLPVEEELGPFKVLGYG